MPFDACDPSCVSTRWFCPRALSHTSRTQPSLDIRGGIARMWTKIPSPSTIARMLPAPDLGSTRSSPINLKLYFQSSLPPLYRLGQAVAHCPYRSVSDLIAQSCDIRNDDRRLIGTIR